MATTEQTSERKVLDSVPNQLFIAGEWRDASGGGTLPVEDPATGQTLIEVADATVEDAKAALTAAHEAQGEWARTAPRDRGEILRRAWEMLMDEIDDLALLMTLEMGKPLAESKAEITYAGDFFHWFAGEATRLDGRFASSEKGGARVLVMKQPVGPCLFITPWNFPLAMATRKIAPAIAAGCTMVLKPANLTPLTALLLTEVLLEAGLPAGVLNVIPTTRPGDVTGPLIRDSRLRKLSFTGSTGVGRQLIADSSHQVLRTSMELGGNAPFLVFEDADLDAALDGAMLAKLRNMGEACTAANRFIVHESLASEFSRRLAERMGSLTLGRGSADGTTIGPLIDAKSRAKVDELVQDAVAGGATALTGGSPSDGDGYFYPPTVLTNVAATARILKEEVFGPVAPVVIFSTEAEAIALANDTEFGLVAYAYTRDLNRGLRLSEQVDVGMFGLNTGIVSNPAAPFGGVKQSGMGREGGSEGIEEYLETRYIGIADPS